MTIQHKERVNLLLVKFIEVGRNKETWETQCKELTYDFMMSQVGMKLFSSDIDFYESEDKKSGKIVVGGFRTVGRWTVEEVEI